MGARTKSRKRALELLFEADQRGIEPAGLLAQRLASPTTQTPLPDYTITLVEGVIRCRAQIDDLISTYSHGWRLERMPAVDRALLRLAVWEVVHSDEVPDAVAIDEAVELAKAMSTDESPGFVHGLLGRIAQVKETL